MGAVAGLGLVIAVALAVPACTSQSEPSTSTPSVAASSPPIVTAPTPDTTTAIARSSNTIDGFLLDDLALELAGVTYAAPSAVCSDDGAAARTAVDQLISRAERHLADMASGWPTTTMSPDSEQLAVAIDHDAVVATAIAIRSGRGGIVRQRWSDINERYAALDGATGGPITDERIAGWEQTAESLAEVLDGACASP